MRARRASDLRLRKKYLVRRNIPGHTLATFAAEVAVRAGGCHALKVCSGPIRVEADVQHNR
jgi:hypothetical protein